MLIVNPHKLITCFLTSMCNVIWQQNAFRQFRVDIGARRSEGNGKPPNNNCQEITMAETLVFTAMSCKEYANKYAILFPFIFKFNNVIIACCSDFFNYSERFSN